jgi:menaquinone-dependent protoporphyrinogen IX oxidase
VIIGTPYNSDGGSYAGKAYLLYGPLYGEIDLAYANASFIGENSHDYAGRSVSSAGDVNGDGYDDVIIGAPYNSDGGGYAGKAYLLYGPLYGEIDLAYADASFIGENAYDYAGESVSQAGDVNRDGYDDVIIGAPYNSDGGSYAGKAYLFYGRGE